MAVQRGTYSSLKLPLLLINRPVTILRSISKIGRSGVPWVYYQNEITGDRHATFISFSGLLRSFWQWLDTVNLLVMAIIQRQAISEVVWQFVAVGDEVYCRKYGWCQVIDKEISVTRSLKYLWLEPKAKETLAKVEPCYVEVF